MEGIEFSGESKFGTVTVDTEGEIAWVPHEDLDPAELEPVELRLALAENHVEYLSGLVRRRLPRSGRREAATAIAKDFQDALVVLECAPQEATDDWVTRTEEGVLDLLSQKARLVYVLSAFVLSVLVSALLLFAQYRMEYDDYPTLLPLSLGCVGGCLGALVSVLQRSRAISEHPLSPRWVLVFQGLLRAMLGVLFGGVVALLVKAGIILDITVPAATPDAEDYAKFKAMLVSLGVVAGFSERLIPEVLGRFEQSLGRGQEEEQGAP